MEIAGMKAIWLHSVNLKLRYTTFIGDGDSKILTCLTELNTYDEDVEIVKHECVGQVQKRMGTALQKLKKSGIEDKNGHLVKFKGSLTDNVITALNIYYGSTIRNNKYDIDGIVQAIDDSFLHSISSDERPMHMKCPKHKPLIKLAGADLKLQPVRIQHRSHTNL